MINKTYRNSVSITSLLPVLTKKYLYFLMQVIKTVFLLLTPQNMSSNERNIIKRGKSFTLAVSIMSDA